MTFQKPQKAPERGALRPRRPPASDRSWQGKRRPGEIGGRELCGVEVPDVALFDVGVREVGAVGGALHGVEIVGEGAVEAAIEAHMRHAAAGEEFEEGGAGARHYGKLP